MAELGENEPKQELSIKSGQLLLNVAKQKQN